IRACLRWVAGSRPPNKLQARGHSTEREGWMEREGACYGYVCQASPPPFQVLRNDVDEVEDMKSPPEREQMSHASRTALRVLASPVTWKQSCSRVSPVGRVRECEREAKQRH
ncbi:Gag-Pro-Pol polyprotein, partial [Dissostichus eleginoides]